MSDEKVQAAPTFDGQAMNLEYMAKEMRGYHLPSDWFIVLAMAAEHIRRMKQRLSDTEQAMAWAAEHAVFVFQTEVLAGPVDRSDANLSMDEAVAREAHSGTGEAVLDALLRAVEAAKKVLEHRAALTEVVHCVQEASQPYVTLLCTGMEFYVSHDQVGVPEGVHRSDGGLYTFNRLPVTCEKCLTKLKRGKTHEHDV